MQSIAAVPPGRWAIGVSGGADSVALLLLMLRRPDVHLHVIHLDHETRQGESGIDATFVAELAARLNLPCMMRMRSAVESYSSNKVKNASSRFRKARFSLFQTVVQLEGLQGILLAHHEDDQIETVLMRLLRGARAENLGGMNVRSSIGGMQVMRPLLKIRSLELRQFLQKNGQTWREDSSNQSHKYQRNRVRYWLENQLDLRRCFVEMKATSATLKSWLKAAAPMLGDSFSVAKLNDLPIPLAKQSAAFWLMHRGIPADLITEKVCLELMEMASDAASSPRKNFPGGLLVRRRQGIIFVEK